MVSTSYNQVSNQYEADEGASYSEREEQHAMEMMLEGAREIEEQRRARAPEAVSDEELRDAALSREEAADEQMRAGAEEIQELKNKETERNFRKHQFDASIPGKLFNFGREKFEAWQASGQRAAQQQQPRQQARPVVVVRPGKGHRQAAGRAPAPRAPPQTHVLTPRAAPRQTFDPLSFNPGRVFGFGMRAQPPREGFTPARAPSMLDQEFAFMRTFRGSGGDHQSMLDREFSALGKFSRKKGGRK